MIATMKLIVTVLADLMTLRNPFRANDPIDLALSLAQWVFLLIVSLAITAAIIGLVGNA